MLNWSIDPRMTVTAIARTTIHIPEGVTIRFDHSGNIAIDCGEEIGRLVIQATAENPAVANDLVNLTIERLTAAMTETA